jgi:hypothetical protein
VKKKAQKVTRCLNAIMQIIVSGYAYTVRC